MKKTKFQRLLAFVLALCFLVGGAISVGAEAGSSLTDTTLDDLKEQLTAVKYEEYREKYLAVLDRAESAIVIPGYAVYEGNNEEGEKMTTAEYEVRKDENEQPYALYTPSTGAVTWQVQIPKAAKYSIVEQLRNDL